MTCPRLKRVKGSLAMTMLNDKIFAIGEGVGSAVFSEDEMFDPALGRWMNSPRSKMYDANLSVPNTFVVWYLVEYSIISNVM